LAQLFWRLFCYDIFGDFFCVTFILRAWNITFGLQSVILELHSLKHHDSPPQVSARLPRNIDGKFWRQLKFFSARDSSQNMNDFLLCRGRNSHLQASASDRLNDFAQALTIGYDPAERHVSLHGPSQRGLGLLGEIIKLMDDNDFE
jgi:hypothetical protein